MIYADIFLRVFYVLVCSLWLWQLSERAGVAYGRRQRDGRGVEFFRGARPDVGSDSPFSGRLARVDRAGSFGTTSGAGYDAPVFMPLEVLYHVLF